MIKVLLLIILSGISFYSYTQNNVGVGTLMPNANAALEIESTDKGLLIPRLTTVQRNIFGVGLTNTENSMLVYDVNDSIFYYWKATVWIPIPGINTDDQNIDSVRLNPIDSVLTVYIEDGLSASVDLKSAFDNTDEQVLTIVGDSLEISNGNRVLFIDNDTTNEKIDSVTYQNDTLTVYEGDSIYKTEIIGGEWSDADKIGLTNLIYAKQALNNGTSDTVVITDDGSFGIGLSNPYNKFQVDGNARIGRIRDVAAVEPAGPGNVLYFSGGPDVSGIFDTDNSDWIGMGRFNLGPDVSELRIRLGDNQGAVDNDAFVLGSALIGIHPWNEYFRVQSNGFVHIGTSALPAYPTNQLHLQGEINPLRVEGIQTGASTDSILTIDATGVIRKIPNSVQGEWNDADSIGMNGFIYSKQALNNGTNDTVVVSDDGKMGIGTSRPLADLHILRPVGKSQIRLETDENNLNSEDDTPGITFHQDGDLVRGYLGYIHGTYTPFTQPVFGAVDNSFLSMANNDASLIALQYAINDTIAMTIDNKRDVGIGTNTPTAKLTIAEDNVTMFMAALVGGGGKQGISSDGDLFLGGESDTYIVSDMNAGAALGDIIFGDRVLGYNTADAGAWVLDDEHMRIDGVTGNVGIETNNPTNKLHVVSPANPLRLEGVQNGATTDSVLSINNTGVVRKVEQVFLPPGMISPFATVAAPTGWLIADGSAVSRTTYANLFAAIGTMYGPGDGATTFNLPDYRGQFLRGVSGASGNDPNAGTRTNRGDGTTGNNVGTKQQDDFETHNHQLKTSSGGAGVDITLVDGPLNDGIGWEQTAANPTPFAGAPDAITYNRGGSETRPTNVSVNYCIKF